MERNDPCWCGSGKKYKKCHMPIEEKIKLHRDRGEIVPSRKLLKTPAQIEKIKKSAALNTAVLDEVVLLRLTRLYMILQLHTVESRLL